MEPGLEIQECFGQFRSCRAWETRLNPMMIALPLSVPCLLFCDQPRGRSPDLPPGVPQKASPMLGGILRSFPRPPGTETGLLPPLSGAPAGKAAAPSLAAPAQHLPRQEGRVREHLGLSFVLMAAGSPGRGFCSLESFFRRGQKGTRPCRSPGNPESRQSLGFKSDSITNSDVVLSGGLASGFFMSSSAEGTACDIHLGH